MAMDFNNKRKIVFSLGAILLSISTIATIAYASLAAYQNKERDELIYHSEIAPLSEYFGGGSGNSATDPYLISTPQQFINLRYLTNLGVFSSNTYFKQTADIDMSSYVLKPIGTDDVPFTAQYLGNGCHIKNPTVSCDYELDVGLFGYVGSGATIRDLIVDNPQIISSYGARDVYEPLREEFANVSLATTLPFTDTTITVSGQSRVNNYKIYYESQDRAVLGEPVNGVMTYVNNSIEVNGEVFMYIDAKVKKEYCNASTNYKRIVSTCTVGRYRVVFKEKKIQSVTEVLKNTQTIKLTVNGTSQDVVASTNPHTYTSSINTNGISNMTYAGFVVGHLDGFLDHIGVYGNSIMNIKGKPTMSYSSIIGKDRSDSLLDTSSNNYYYQDLYFDQLISAYPTQLAGKTIAKETVDSTAYTMSLSSRTYKPNINNCVWNKGYTDIFDAINLPDYIPQTNGYVRQVNGGIEFPDVFKIYGDAYTTSTPFSYTIEGDRNTYLGNALQLRDNIGWQGYLDRTDLRTTSITCDQFIGINNYGIVTAGSYKASSFLYPENHAHIRTDYDIDSGIWFFVDQEDTTGFWNRISQWWNNDTGKTVYCTIKLTYTMDTYDDDAKWQMITCNRLHSYSEVQATQSFLVNTNKHWCNDTWEKHTEDEGEAFDLPVLHNSSDTRILQTRSFSLATNGTSTGSIWNSGSMYPMIVIGLENLDSGNEVNIMRIELLISNDKGNASLNVACVDFLYSTSNTYNASLAEWTSWDASSDTKISFIVYDNGDGASMGEGLLITYTRASNFAKRVTVSGTCATADYGPSNTVGYQRATFEVTYTR